MYNEQPDGHFASSCVVFAAGDAGEGEKSNSNSLASRLLSKKASKRTDKLTFGSNAQACNLPTHHRAALQ
jgi:hypothetical protein